MQSIYNVRTGVLVILALFFCTRHVAIVRADRIDDLIEQLKDQDRDIRKKSAEDLIGVTDKRVIGPLIVALNDADCRDAAAKALAQIGEPVVTPLVLILREQLKDSFGKQYWNRAMIVKVLVEV